MSALCARLDPLVDAWRNRALTERYPFLLVDGIVILIREDGQVRQRSLLIASGVRESGHREILGVSLGDSESEASWSELFEQLKKRGLTGVDFVTSDHHAGLVNAIGRNFQGATWQRCQAYFLRNIMDVCPEKERETVLSHVRQIMDAPTIEVARERLAATLAACSEKAKKAMACLEAGFEDAIAVLGLPSAYRRRLRTTNSVERMNEEIRRRERVIRIFPNRESAIRLLGALLMEFDEAWSTGKIYLDMTEYNKLRADRETPKEAGITVGKAPMVTG